MGLDSAGLEAWKLFQQSWAETGKKYVHTEIRFSMELHSGEPDTAWVKQAAMNYERAVYAALYDAMVFENDSDQPKSPYLVNGTFYFIPYRKSNILTFTHKIHADTAFLQELEAYLATLPDNKLSITWSPSGTGEDTITHPVDIIFPRTPIVRSFVLQGVPVHANPSQLIQMLREHFKLNVHSAVPKGRTLEGSSYVNRNTALSQFDEWIIEVETPKPMAKQILAKREQTGMRDLTLFPYNPEETMMRSEPVQMQYIFKPPSYQTVLTTGRSPHKGVAANENVAPANEGEVPNKVHPLGATQQSSETRAGEEQQPGQEEQQSGAEQQPGEEQQSGQEEQLEEEEQQLGEEQHTEAEQQHGEEPQPGQEDQLAEQQQQTGAEQQRGEQEQQLGQEEQQSGEEQQLGQEEQHGEEEQIDIGHDTRTKLARGRNRSPGTFTIGTQASPTKKLRARRSRTPKQN
ncbi:hypothetical protein PSENEW3n2_00000913 [Picochlorum sp. SENEW3]|nr:hypothetical protein PSENEW3n2_00000913 [Picochlorum sp. SENEW3]WPT14969.1 hypothetical protein PSENEW3_00000913 [Picochlorum sp. SENEW3]